MQGKSLEAATGVEPVMEVLQSSACGAGLKSAVVIRLAGTLAAAVTELRHLAPMFRHSLKVSLATSCSTATMAASTLASGSSSRPTPRRMNGPNRA